MKRLVRLALVAGLAIWAWRYFTGSGEPHERVGVSYADGSSVVLEPGSAAFERLASIARTAIRG